MIIFIETTLALNDLDLYEISDEIISYLGKMWFMHSNGVFPKWNRNSRNSANSGNLINN